MQIIINFFKRVAWLEHSRAVLRYMLMDTFATTMMLTCCLLAAVSANIALGLVCFAFVIFFLLLGEYENELLCRRLKAATCSVSPTADQTKLREAFAGIWGEMPDEQLAQWERSAGSFRRLLLRVITVS